MSEQWRPGETRFLGLRRGPAIAAGVVLLLSLTAIGAGVIAWLGVGGILFSVASIVAVAFVAWLWVAQWTPLAWWLASRANDEGSRADRGRSTRR